MHEPVSETGKTSKTDSRTFDHVQLTWRGTTPISRCVLRAAKYIISSGHYHSNALGAPLPEDKSGSRREVLRALEETEAHACPCMHYSWLILR